MNGTAYQPFPAEVAAMSLLSIELVRVTHEQRLRDMDAAARRRWLFAGLEDGTARDRGQVAPFTDEVTIPRRGLLGRLRSRTPEVSR